MNSSIDEGIKRLLERAIDLDRAGHSKEAAQLYLKASNYLLKLWKTEKLPTLKKMYYEKAQECVARVKVLTGIETSSSTPAAGKPVKDLPGKPSKRRDEPTKEAESEVDEDTKKLREMLSETIVIESPDVSLDDVAGLEDVKETISEAIILPMKHPELFIGKARRPWKGILLFGPPGCGKTYLSKAVASEVNATFYNVSAANIVSKWLGESEKLVKALFDLARRSQPAIIFMDELDAIGTARSGEDVGGERRMKTQLLVEIEGLGSKENERILVLAATNLPWQLDPALLSRFEKKLYVPLPDHEARKAIFQSHLQDIDLDPSVDLNELAELTEGYSGRDISILCREAAMTPIRELAKSGAINTSGEIYVRAVVREDFIKALEKIKPSATPELIAKYEKWAEEF